jgi:hypothetical protein
VQLLPYQRQTLHFMQQQEDLPLGFSSHFYVPLAMPCGMQYWYSPVWRHACLEPPVTPKGGFLGECVLMVVRGWVAGAVGAGLHNIPMPQSL